MTCSEPLYCDWTERLFKLALRWSEVPESANQGSWQLVKAAFEAEAIVAS